MPISYIYTGQPMTGTAQDDFMIGYAGSTGTSDNTINGGDGDDWILADSSDTWLPNASYLNGSIGSAFNFETITSTWTTSENPMFGDSLVPHTTAIVEATIGEAEYFRVVVGAGETLTVDIDYGHGGVVGGNRDLIVEILDGSGNILATGDDSFTTQGGLGSSSLLDPYLTFSAPAGGAYYIRVRPFSGPAFTANDVFLLNVSVTGHAVGSLPVGGADVVNGGEGDDQIFGQGGADILNGDGGNDTIHGGSGHDVINGGDGADILYGGDGTEETVHGGQGADLLISGGEGHYFGDEGNDIIQAGLTSGVNEVLDGGADIDTVDTRSWNGAYEVNLATGVTNFGESFINFENIISGNGADIITGTSGANVIITNDGADTVNAGDGDDTVAGGLGADTLNGEGGTDMLDYRESNAAIFVTLSINSVSGGHAQGDIVSGFEGVFGSNFDDTLYGTAGGDILIGGYGNDTLSSGYGHDILDGGAGADILTGGDGTDETVNGGEGNDILFSGGEGHYYGDGGNDTVYAGMTLGDIGEYLDGGTGEDTLNLTAFATPYVLNMITGVTNYALESFINFENVLTGDGADTITGTAGDNDIWTGAGADTVLAGDGNDVVVGGAGADSLHGQGGMDILSYTGSDAGVTVNLLTGAASGGHAAGDVFTGFESVVGTAFADVLTGDAGVNNLLGGEGDDILNGGAGQDFMYGDTGNDTYVIGLSTDVVIEGVGQGTDLVQAWASFTLSANVENMTLFGGGLNGTGNGLANVIYGNANNNIILGEGGNDALYGEGGDDLLNGGAGDDVALGGLGNDTYVLGSLGDMIFEYSGQGTDTVQAYINGYTLEGHLENLVLMGGAVTGYGNNLANVLTGTDGVNFLYGREGHDTINGGLGNDTLYGEIGDDTLNGGSGDDVMNGGTGNDVYVVGSLSDQTHEAVGEGFDTTQAYVNWVLWANVEALTLLGAAQYGSGNSTDNWITGNNLDNYLYGNGGSDTLTGGLGNDRLYGGVGVGNDVFVQTGTNFGQDLIYDFQAGAAVGDVIQLTTAMFLNFADVLVSATDVGGNCVISRYGQSITLVGVLKAQLHANDFQFFASSPLEGSQAKDVGPLVLVGEQAFKDIGPLVLPDGLGGKADDSQGPLVIPDVFDPLEPLVLPSDFSPKGSDADVAVICPVDPVIADMALEALGGHGSKPMHRLAQPADFDWTW